jgi:hypothetical protein
LKYNPSAIPTSKLLSTRNAPERPATDVSIASLNLFNFPKPLAARATALSTEVFKENLASKCANDGKSE